MFLKRFLFIVVGIIVISCGGTKQVASTSSEKKSIATSETNISIEIKDSLEIINHTEETKTIIKSDTVVQKNNTQKKDSIYFISEPSHQKSVNHTTWHALLQKYVSKNGNVNYKGFKSDKAKFYAYIEKLQNTPPQDSWTRNQTLAYWINAYNAFTVDLILRHYPLQSIKDIKDPWDQRLWKIDSKWYNLNDIEHQILRKMNEPRIHFAIVCASVSCPKLQNFAFNGLKLDDQLNLATHEFLADTSKNSITSNSLKLSKIFKWFSKDFKTKDSNLIDFLNQHTDIEISKTAKKSFLDYNWDLNE